MEQQRYYGVQHLKPFDIEECSYADDKARMRALQFPWDHIRAHGAGPAALLASRVYQECAMHYARTLMGMPQRFSAQMLGRSFRTMANNLDLSLQFREFTACLVLSRTVPLVQHTASKGGTYWLPQIAFHAMIIRGFGARPKDETPPVTMERVFEGKTWGLELNDKEAAILYRPFDAVSASDNLRHSDQKFDTDVKPLFLGDVPANADYPDPD